MGIRNSRKTTRLVCKVATTAVALFGILALLLARAKRFRSATG
jgi:hypothetical protein